MLRRQSELSRVEVDRDLQPASGRTVVVYEAGGVCSQAAAIGPGGFFTTIHLYEGHGLEVNDIIIRNIDPSHVAKITIVTPTTVRVGGTFTTDAGDVILNLGDDSTPGPPAYDGSPVLVYDTPAPSTPLADGHVGVNDEGEYGYWHDGRTRLWELVLDGAGLPEEIVMDAYAPSVGVAYEEQWAHTFATSGDGTVASPWATSGSNPIQAALNALPSTGGTVRMVAGNYDLGSATVAVNIPILTSTTDRRAYSFVGAGRDLTFLRYSGSGSAFRYAQVNTGTLGVSWQSNQLVFRGFTTHQTNSPRTGTAFLMTYVSESLWEDLTVGNVRQDRQSGENDYGFAYGVRLYGTAGDNVCDFNRFDNCYFMGNGTAIYGQNQCDNTVITRCSFEPRQTAADVQNGVNLVNSSGIHIAGNHFNFFQKDQNAYALRFDTDVSGVLVQGNYFEKNWNAIWLYSDGNQDGIVIQGNLFALSANGLAGPIYRCGVRAGIDSATWSIRGLTIQSNEFQGIQDYCRGVRIGGDVRSYLLLNNRYEVTGSTDSYNNTRVVASGFGSEGITIEGLPESSSTTNETPVIHISHKAENFTAINLRNTNAGTQKSPRIRFEPTAAVGANFSLEAGTAGQLNFVDHAGTVIGSISQLGALAFLSLATTGDSTLGNADTDLTTNVGRLILRTISTDPTSSATAGTIGEVVYSSSTAKFYGKHTATASDTNWRLLGT